MKTKETTNRGIGKCIIFLMVILFSTISFSAHAKSYGFKIDGVEVTSDNYSDLTGGNISGIVKYNPTTNTVTLTNVTINRTISDGRCIDNFNNSGLIVELKGTNNLTAKTSPVKLQKETTFKATSGSTTNMKAGGTTPMVYMSPPKEDLTSTSKEREPSTSSRTKMPPSGAAAMTPTPPYVLSSRGPKSTYRE